MSGRIKFGSTLDVKTLRIMKALASATGLTRADLIKEGIQRVLAELSEPKKRRFEQYMQMQASSSQPGLK